MFENLFLFLQTNTTLTYIIVALLGLSVGSFLNVVIYRLPLILKQSWHNECQLFLHPDNPNLLTEKITLSTPRSRCTTCNNQIRWFHNIPVLSWLFLKGKCGFCSTRISPIYPLIELLTSITSIIVVFKFGLTIQALASLVFTWLLIAITFIDFTEQIIPDRIVYPLFGMGLIISTYNIFVSPDQSIWGAMIGFLSLWIIYIIFKAFTGKEGMGYGDFKLLMALGAWFGPFALPNLILVSAVLGCLIGIALIQIRKESKPFAFGPYLAISGWIYLIFGNLVL